jgi:hypothetical protein
MPEGIGPAHLKCGVPCAGLCGLQSSRRQIKTGPAARDGVPDFAAPDQAGRTQTLKSTMGPKGGTLVFYRSADW